jgi:hypothetical protein
VAKLSGTLEGGAPFSKSVTAKTRRLMIREPLATVDLSALTAAPNLEVLELDGPATLQNLDTLHALEKLTELSLTVHSTADLSPLASVRSLRFLYLRVHGDASFETNFLPPSLASLSIVLYGASRVRLRLAGTQLESLYLDGFLDEELDLGFVTPNMTSLNITKARNLTALDLAPLAKTKLRYLHIMNVPLRVLDLAPLADTPLERLHITELALGELSLAAFARSTTLRAVVAYKTGIFEIDLSALAGLPTLDAITLDDDVRPYLAESLVKSIKSPGVRAWHKANALTIE